MKWFRKDTECELYEAQVPAEIIEEQIKAEGRLEEAEERLNRVRRLNTDLKQAMERNHIREAIQHAIREKAK